MFSSRATVSCSPFIGDYADDNFSAGHNGERLIRWMRDATSETKIQAVVGNEVNCDCAINASLDGLLLVLRTLLFSEIAVMNVSPLPDQRGICNERTNATIASAAFDSTPA
jgi:hypothetical protein